MYTLIQYIAIFLWFIVTMSYLIVFLRRWRVSCCHTHLSPTIWTSNHQSGICSTLSLVEASLRICDLLCLQCSYQYVYQRQQLTYYTSRRTNPNFNFYTYEFKLIQFYPISKVYLMVSNSLTLDSWLVRSLRLELESLTIFGSFLTFEGQNQLYLHD